MIRRRVRTEFDRRNMSVQVAVSDEDMDWWGENDESELTQRQELVDIGRKGVAFLSVSLHHQRIK